MDLNKKYFLDVFTQKENEENNSFVLVIEKINEIFVDILNDISEKLNGQVAFKLNLIGEHYLGTNYGFNNSANMLIEYYTKQEDLEFSQKRAKKGRVGKLYSDIFNTKNNLVFTIEELSRVFFNELTLRLKNASVFIRKNQISLKYLDFKFFIFFVSKEPLENDYEFIIKNKEFKLNLSEMHENLLKKDAETNGNFFNLIKFYKIIELELMFNNKLVINCSKIPYFYENLLYNIPNNLIDNELIYDNFLTSFSYLLNANLKDFISADNYILINDLYKIHSKNYITTLDVKKLLQQVEIFINSVDNILVENIENNKNNQNEND